MNLDWTVTRKSALHRLESDVERLEVENARMCDMLQGGIKAKRRRAKWSTYVAVIWLFIIGVIVGGLAVPRMQDSPTLIPDYPTCISTARVNSPLPDNPYQELVNALYTCGIYP